MGPIWETLYESVIENKSKILYIYIFTTIEQLQRIRNDHHGPLRNVMLVELFLHACHHGLVCRQVLSGHLHLLQLLPKNAMLLADLVQFVTHAAQQFHLSLNGIEELLVLFR